MCPALAADPEWLNAEQAATRLGVSRPTLYAYVSRGRLRAHPVDGRRERRYRRSDVERLAALNAAARQPRRVAVQTLDWGLPVLTSTLTLIEQGRFFYRGQDAVALATRASLEDVAALLWDCDRTSAFAPADPPLDAPTRALLRRSAALPLPARLVGAWGLLAPLAHERSDLTRPQQAAGLLRRMALAGTLQQPARGRPVHEHLQRAWRLPAEAAPLLRQALVLCADHELNASSFTARCVAATGASLGAAVGAGLAALSGPRHGGMTGRVEALWPQVVDTPRNSLALRRWIADEVERRLQQRQARGQPRTAGDSVAGFGHPLYPDGDPRARALLALLPAHARRDRFAALVQDLTGQPPALDFALVALRRHLGAPEGTAFVLFALARTVGWLAHAIEQQDSGSLIRPRAAYVGPRPLVAAPAPAGRVIRRR